MLLCPYFKFVEEQVAIPWQRVCAAAAKHEQGSEALTLVAQMLPMASEISSTVYCQLLQLFPDHRQLVFSSPAPPASPAYPNRIGSGMENDRSMETTISG